MPQACANAHRLVSLLFLCLIQVTPVPVSAAVRTWIGGNVDWLETAGADLNWNLNFEPDAADEAVFNTANTVDLGTNNLIQTLTLSGGIDLATNTFDLTVSGTISATGAGTNFIVEGSTSLVDANLVTVGSSATVQIDSGDLLADDVTLTTGGTLRFDGGDLTVDEDVGNGILDIDAGAAVTGFGSIDFVDAPAAVSSLLINDGTLSANRPSLSAITPPSAGTLEINATEVNARINLDGGVEAGVVNVNRNQTLEINGTLSDAFSGDLNMFHDTVLDISTAWSMDAGTFDVANGFVNNPIPTPDIPAGTSTVTGGAFSQSGGTITNSASDGTLELDTAFTQTGGNFVNNGLVVFGGNTLIDDTANFTMPTNTSSIRVGTGAVVNVDQANFNVDGNGTATNVITIGSGGQLDLDLGAGADDTITGTVVLGGGELDVTTADNTWSLGGSVSTLATSGASQLNGEALSFDDATMTVPAGSTLDVNAASTWNAGTSFDIDGLVTIDGAATINFISSNAVNGAGTLRFGSTSSFTAVNTEVAVATFDWDGTTAGQVHTFAQDAQLFINSTTFDSDGDMDDSITMADGADLIVNNVAQWEMRGTLTTSGTLAKPVGIGGDARMVLTSATGIWNVNGAVIPDDVTFGPSSVTNIAVGAQTIASAVNDMIYAGGTITGAGTFSPHVQNTVTADSSITVDDFNFDNGEWTVQNNALLTVDVADYDNLATNSFDATMTVDASRVNIRGGDPQFVMNGVLNMIGSPTNDAFWDGDPLHIGDNVGLLNADLNVTGSGRSEFNFRVTFNADADVNIAAGATLVLDDPATFNTVEGGNNASIHGAGAVRFNNSIQFNEAITFDMVGGTVDFDGDNTLAGDTVHIDAPVVINAATMESFGQTNGAFNNILEIDNFSAGTSGTLTVNLDDPNAEWTLNAPGVMNLINGGTEATLLAGSDVNLNGTVNVSGDVRVTARIDFGSTAVVNINTAGEPLRLAGGDLSTVINPDPNTIAGATINGPGLFGADNGKALVGFGTINANVDFDGTAELFANDGTLTINGAILDVARIGTEDDDGVLNIVNPWNTSVASFVSLEGGALQGGAMTIDNGNGVAGFGTITARLTNNTRLRASGGTLVAQTAGNDNDWDGTGSGVLAANNNGTLELRDVGAAFGFAGTVEVSNNSRVLANGFALDFNPGSTINLTGGTYESTQHIPIGGAVIVNAGAASTLKPGNSTFVTFEAGSSTTLNGNLQLDSIDGEIEAGATFSGSGALIIPELSHVTLEPNANANVLVINDGTLQPNGFNTVGRVDVKDYQQGVTGTLVAELTGTALNQYDRVVVNGNAVLDGNVEVQLDGGFAPVLGNEFNILSASGGLTGAVAIDQPGNLPPGLFFNARFEPTILQIVVTDSLPGDYNRDNSVDAADYIVWRKMFGAAVADFVSADGNGDGLIDDDDYGVWQRHFGTVPPPGSGGGESVPEPTTILLLAVCGLSLIPRMRMNALASWFHRGKR